MVRRGACVPTIIGTTAGQIAGLEAQERELPAAGCDKIFREQVSSVAQRQQLEAVLDWPSSPGWKPRRFRCGSSQCPAIKPSIPLPATAGSFMLSVIAAVRQAERDSPAEGRWHQALRNRQKAGDCSGERLSGAVRAEQRRYEGGRLMTQTLVRER
jgi:hypothetical protein